MRPLGLSVLVVFAATIGSLPAEQLSCGCGEFVMKNETTGQASCEQCPDGFYVDNDYPHSLTTCKDCLEEWWYSYEILACPDKCHPPRIVACEGPRYLNVYPPDPSFNQCDVCTICEDLWLNPYELRPCTNNTDTVCCSQPTMIVEEVKGEWICRENTTFVTGDIPSDIADAGDSNNVDAAESGTNSGHHRPSKMLLLFLLIRSQLHY